MMFLQFFIWGVWYVPMYPFLLKLGVDPVKIGFAYSLTGVAAMISPIFVGMIADKFFPSQIVLGCPPPAWWSLPISRIESDRLGFIFPIHPCAPALLHADPCTCEFRACFRQSPIRREMPPRSGPSAHWGGSLRELSSGARSFSLINPSHSRRPASLAAQPLRGGRPTSAALALRSSSVPAHRCCSACFVSSSRIRRRN